MPPIVTTNERDILGIVKSFQGLDVRLCLIALWLKPKNKFKTIYFTIKALNETVANLNSKTYKTKEDTDS